jgi:flagellum-specific peptidoglycan hydrolase FlgJ
MSSTAAISSSAFNFPLLTDPRRLFNPLQLTPPSLPADLAQPMVLQYPLLPALNRFSQGQANPSLSLFETEKPELSLEQVRQGGIVAIGDKGPAIKWMQESLTKLGYGVQASGELGSTTQALLQKFQKDYGVEPTGKLGPTTLKTLEWALKQTNAIQQLRKVTPAQLKNLKAENFFKTLLPAALESERVYNVPAAVTLAQAALESGFGASPIGGYNIFGIKGSGPAGSAKVNTTEFINGQYVSIKAGFAKYHDFYEAVSAHGKLYHNGYYDKGMAQFAKDRNVNRFIDSIAKTYATDPHYASKLKSLIKQFGIDTLVNESRKIPS